MVIRFMVLVVAAWLSAAPVRAADPVFPLGSRIGLAPPSGLVPSHTFEGFEDSDNKVAIVLIELAPAAYAQEDSTPPLPRPGWSLRCVQGCGWPGCTRPAGDSRRPLP